MTTSTSLVSGLSSGFDWRSLVDELIAVDRRRVTLVETKKNDYEKQLTEWQGVNTKLLSLKSAAEALTRPENFNRYRPSMSSDSTTVKASELLSAVASSSAAHGTYTIKVIETAAAERLASRAFESISDALGLSGEITINGVAVTVKEEDSLAVIRSKINDADAGVTASIVSYEENDHRLTLTGKTTGAEGIDIGGSSAILDSFNFTQITAGRDAQVSIDGVTITRSSNLIEGVIEGVTLNLLKADADTTVTLSVDRDTDSVMNDIKSLVAAYNEVAEYINKQRSYDEESGKTGGVLFGDGTLASVRNDLTNSVMSPVIGVDPRYSLLNFVGITLDRNGLLVVDEEELSYNLESNFDAIVGLFAVQGVTEGNNLSFVYGTSPTQPGTYDVSITQAAAKATAIGTVDLTGGLEGDVTLAVVAGGYRAIVELEAGMTSTGIVDAINAELGAARAEIRVGSEKLYAGEGQTSHVTAYTTWDQVYVGETPAGLENGSLISFSGTDHHGRAVSGSYEITDVESDTIQGLLSKIETAYGGDVTASIDGEGRIVIESSEAGPSRLSLSFDMSRAGNLSFGEIGISEDGADGSRQGRNALPVIASDDGTGKLVLSHTNYGGSASFTVRQFGAGSLGLDDGDYQGRDVAGTINGEEAAGSGQVLTGRGSRTEGLSIRYTGSEPAENAGTVTFITGVAEQFNRTLAAITDPYEGYVAFKRQSLTSSIKLYEDRIERMNEQLNRQAQRMINRFVAMETALSRMQSQSDWMVGQINSIFSAWQF